MTLIKVAILTVSDSCYSGHVRDKGAANLKSMIEEKKLINGKVVLEGCVPDAVEQIKSKLTLWSDEDKVDLILTTGGTGFAPRDVTPEATKAVLQKEAPGLMLAMLKGSLEKTHFAMLSRPACGIRGRTLIINLPGSRTGSAECFGFLLPALPHAFDLLSDRKQAVNATHDELHNVTPSSQMSHTMIEQRQDVVRSDSVDGKKLRSGAHTKPVILSRPSSRCRSRQTIYKVILPTSKQTKKTKEIDEDHSIKGVDNGSEKAHESVISEPDPLAKCTSNLEVNNSSNDKRSDKQSKRTTPNTPNLEPIPELSTGIKTSLPTKPESRNSTCKDSSKSKDISEEHFTNSIGKDLVKETNSATQSNLGVHALQCSEECDDDVGDDEDNTLDESNDYSNPRSTESLDMECHESGDDTVIIVKEKPRGKKRKNVETGADYVIAPKLHKSKTEGKVHFVPVGEPFKKFLESHAMVQGMYLNRGKRAVKRKLVSVMRQKDAIDTGSWKRGASVHARNRLDDAFELTQDGAKRAEQIGNKARRDEYVVNWYLWCPGHSNCQRKCGSIGRCAEGCKGMKHKQDRHNCSLLLNMKLFLSNLSEWRIHMSGSHLPEDSPIVWQPPAPEMQKMGEDVKDVIFKYYGKESNSNIAELLVKQNQLKGHDQNTSKKRVSYFVSSMKKRRRERDYSLAESMKNKEVKVYPTIQTQQEIIENSSRFYQLRQLSDQQIVDALREDTDGQALGLTVANSSHSESSHFQCQLQTAVSDQSDIALNPVHSTQELAVHYLDVSHDDGEIVQYQTVSGETTVFVTLDTDESTL